MKKILLIAAAGLSLCGCGAALVTSALQTVVSASRPAEAVGDKVVLEGTRGLVLMHNVFQGGLSVVTPLVDEKKLTPAQVDRFEQIVDEGERLFAGADKTLSNAQRTASILNLSNELYAMAGR